ncbi:MAG: hypothetical protein HY007_03100 [Candidatus Sungbacteria bacterium]|nr:hypothetical protein [Candidatus Sungbacteria bacterium]
METRNCQNCKKEFLIEPEDFSFYERIKVPPPTWCPDCRMIRRFLFRNERLLFRRKDDQSGKEIFSSFPAGAPVKMYEREYWWSDKWDPMGYGKAYDFTRPFFEQFRELFHTVPLYSKSTLGNINSDYCDNSGWMKNSYLCFDAGTFENVAYAVKGDTVKDSLDIYEVSKSEFCYESVILEESYRVFFSMDCERCSDVWFSKDLTSCNNCFGCVNLRNKSYHIFNRPYSREEYLEEIKKFNVGSHQSMLAILQKARESWTKFPVKYLHGYHNVNVSGQLIYNSKNTNASYSVQDAENVKYSQMLWMKIADSYDYTSFGFNASLIYECLVSGFQSSGLKFSWECWDACRDLEYSAYCSTSSNLFGCIGLRKKSYCIFNKQYAKEDYFAMREKIIQHMNDMPYTDRQGRTYRYGEFFPPEFSPFAYNETLTHDFFPLSKEEAEAKGYVWREPEVREFQTTIRAQDLPDHINDVTDDILKEVISCGTCGKAYRLIPMELAFYRSMGIPLPRACPNCRFLERFRHINPPKFWRRACQCNGALDERNIYQNVAEHLHGSGKCLNEFETSYAPDCKEIVYCESCYQQEVV